MSKSQQQERDALYADPDKIRRMAMLLIEETTDDSMMSSIGSLEDAVRVVERMLAV